MQVVKGESESVLRISGPLGIGVSDELRNVLLSFIPTVAAPIVDLSEVDVCDTAALQLLCSAQLTAARNHQVLELRLPVAIREAGEALGLSFRGSNGTV